MSLVPDEGSIFIGRGREEVTGSVNVWRSVVNRLLFDPLDVLMLERISSSSIVRQRRVKTELSSSDGLAEAMALLAVPFFPSVFLLERTTIAVFPSPSLPRTGEIEEEYRHPISDELRPPHE